MKIDETKLTAYAIDELPQDERESFARELDADSRDEIAQIRVVAQQLESALQTESRVAAGPQVRGPVARRHAWRLAAAASLALAVGTGVIVITSLDRAQNRKTVAIAPALQTLSHIGGGSPANQLESQPTQMWVDKIQQQSEPPKASDRNFQTRLKEQKSELSVQDKLSPLHGAPDVADPRIQAATVAPNFDLRSSPQPPAAKLAPADPKQIVRGGREDRADYKWTRESRPPLQEAQAQFDPNSFAAAPERVGNTESYDRITDNAFLDVVANPLSTFSIDVDTASYSNMRRFLAQNQLPPPDAVRIEELINYFPYDYNYPADSKGPFAASVEVAECPWNPSHRLARVGIKAKDISLNERPASNLVFLLDVSGSMNEPNKLPLVKSSMRMLVEKLGENDHVTIVVYAGNSGLVLPPTNGMHKKTILAAIEQLQPGGSTNGAGGITLAYEQAQSGFVKGGTNRVILATDGDFNVGITDQGQLTRLIEEKAKGGVFLSVLGFGMGNLKDSTMEKLADKGNGNYAYIDTPNEAKKVLVEQMTGTLVTVAKDVKIQIEFNPAVASSYRLIGYENRMLAKEDFNDDKKDAGEIGAGHTVTALYEIVPAGEKGESPKADELKYQKGEEKIAKPASGELMTLKIRYKEPDGDNSKLMEFPITDGGATYAKASEDFKFTSSVAAFGMLLRNSPHKGTASFGGVLEWAGEGVGGDASGYRHEFIELVRKAQGIKGG